LNSHAGALERRAAASLIGDPMTRDDSITLGTPESAGRRVAASTPDERARSMR
jgi:hypothetical protein